MLWRNEMVEIAIGSIILVIIFSIVPIIGDAIDTSVAIDESSQWAADGVPTGADIWKSNAPLTGLIGLGGVMILIHAIRRIGADFG
ncbi:MAG: hypothetical protein ACXQS5_04505 [Candidatus Methanospirareceae archaeon]